MGNHASPPRWDRRLIVSAGHVVAAGILGAAAAADLSIAVLGVNAVPVFSHEALGIAALAAAALGAPVAVVVFAVLVVLSSLARRAVSEPQVLVAGAAVAGLFGLAVVAALFGGAEAVMLFAGRHLVLAGSALAACVLTFGLGTRGALRHTGVAAVAVAFVPVALVAADVPWQWESGEAAVEPGERPHGGKLVLVGIDGLCDETLARIEARGGLPELDWLRERALIGPLETIVPTQSPTVWSSIATGRVPDDHGVLSFTSWDVSVNNVSLSRVPRYSGAFAWLRMAESMGLIDLRQVSSANLRTPPLWEIFADPERPSTVAGWWCSWPAAPISGQLVSDRFYFWREVMRAGEGGGHQTGLTFPVELEQEIGGVRMAPTEMTVEQVRRFTRLSREQASELLADGDYHHHSIQSELPLAYTMDETYFDLAEKMLAEGPDEGFYAFYMRGVDLVSHAAMHASDLYPEGGATEEERAKYGPLIEEYYAYTFARLRRLVRLAGPDAKIMVVSDHGFEKIRPGEYGHENAPDGVIMVMNPSPGVSLGTRKASIYDVAPTASLGTRKASIYDVAPTMLWLSGYPAADDMPGRELVEAFPRLAAQAPPLPRIATYGPRWQRTPVHIAQSDDVDAEQLEILRSLGYIE